jgi:hypothetical protein
MIRTLLAVAVMTTSAHADCLTSAAAVRASHADAYPMWTLRMIGHAGEQCWYAGREHHAAAKIPLPRPRMVHREITQDEIRSLVDWYDTLFPAFADRWP